MTKSSQRFSYALVGRTLEITDVLKIPRSDGDSAVVFVADLDEYQDNVEAFLLGHGLKTKFQQFVSDDSVEAKLGRWAELDDMFRQGILEQERSGGGFGPTGLWVEALAGQQGVSFGAMQEHLKDYTKEARKELKASVEDMLGDRIEELREAKADADKIDLSQFKS